ncbi:hypothetical protein MUP35_04435, partial [Patescibacteria group bacterium]|nr:hypothetical protein [Patescibacteria group bacterium]
MIKSKRKFWTKDEISYILDLWQSKTIDELSNELDRKGNAILYMARKIRQLGYALPRKHRVKIIDNLIKEVLK